MATPIGEYYFDVKFPSTIFVDFERIRAGSNKLNLSFISLMTTTYALSHISKTAFSVFKDVVDEFSEFEYAMKGVKAVSNATDAEFRKLWNTARELGRATRYSGVEVANALEELSLLGLSVPQSLKSLPQILDLAATEGMNLKDAAEIAVGSMYALNLSVQDLSRVNDELAYVATNSASTIYDLGASLKVVGSMASNSGQTMETILPVLGGLSNQMIHAENAGHAVGQMLARLMQASRGLGGPIDEVGSRIRRAKKAIKDIGIEIVDATGAMRPLTDILYDLGEANVSTSTLLDIFGIYTVKAAAAAINAAESIRKLEWALKGTGLAVEGTAKKIAQMRLDSQRGEILKLINNFKDLKIEIGEKASASVTMFSRITNLIIRNTTDWISVNQKAVSTIVIFTGALGVLGIAATAVTAAVFALTFGGAPLVLALSGLVYTALKLTDGLNYITKGSLGTKEGLEKLGEAFNKVKRSIQLVIDLFVILKGSIDAVVNPVFKFFDDFEAESASFVKEIGSNITLILHYFDKLAQNSNFYQKVKSWGIKAKESVTEIFKGMLNPLSVFTDKASQDMIHKLSNAFRKEDFKTSTRFLTLKKLIDPIGPMLEDLEKGSIFSTKSFIPKLTVDSTEAVKVREDYYNLVDSFYDTLELRDEAYFKNKETLYDIEDEKARKVLSDMLAISGKEFEGEYAAVIALLNQMIERKSALNKIEKMKEPLENKLKLYESSLKMSKEEYQARSKLIDLEMQEASLKIKDPTELTRIKTDNKLKLQQDYISRYGGLEKTMYDDTQKMTEGKYNLELDLINKKYDLYKQDAIDFVALEEWKAEKVRELNKRKLEMQGTMAEGFKVYYEELKAEGWSWAKAGYDAAKQMQSGISNSFYSFFDNMRTDAKNWRDHLIQYFDDMASAFAQAIQRMIADYLALQAIKAVTSMFTTAPSVGPLISAAGSDGGGGVLNRGPMTDFTLNPLTPSLAKRESRSREKETIIFHQTHNFNVNAVDQQSVTQFLKKNAGTIQGIAVEGIRKSYTVRKAIRGNK